MIYQKIQNYIIVIVSFMIGVLGFIQYKSISKDYHFVEYNPFREILILLEGNKDMSHKITDLEKRLNKLKNSEEINKNAVLKIQEANLFAGNLFEYNESVSLLLEGVVSLKNIIDITHIIWNAGAENITLNGIPFSHSSGGLEKSGGQILLGGTPINSPYSFNVFGNTANLIKILNPETGVWSEFQKDRVRVTVSLEEK